MLYPYILRKAVFLKIAESMTEAVSTRSTRTATTKNTSTTLLLYKSVQRYCHSVEQERIILTLPFQKRGIPQTQQDWSYQTDEELQ